MFIKVQCENTGCAKRLKVKEELVGKRAKCPACGHSFIIPASRETPEPEEAPAPAAPKAKPGLLSRVFGPGAPRLPEEQRRAIFGAFIKARNQALLLGTNLAQEFQAASFGNPLASLGAMKESLNRNAAKADEAAVARITKEYGVSIKELRAIEAEGKKNKW
ncbi:MAG: hypothetical protein U0797_15940 [Gemmataceae bacterium]